MNGRQMVGESFEADGVKTRRNDRVIEAFRGRCWRHPACKTLPRKRILRQL